MADIRINSLPTTASASSSDDFLALDGATNGTRKLNAYSPTFGGNLTVSGTGTSSFGGLVKATGNAATSFGVEIANGTGSSGTAQYYLTSGNGAGFTAFRLLRGNGAAGYEDNGFNADSFSGARFNLNALGGSGGNFTISGGNLTVSGTGTSSVAGYLGVGRTDISASVGLGFFNVTYPYAKTDTTLRNVASWSSNEAAGSTWKLILTSKGNATAASRFFSLQTSNEGVANNGILALQDNGGVVTLGTSTNSGNGIIQLADHTSSAGGIGFGTDVSLFRSAAGVLRLASTSNYSHEIVNTGGTGAATTSYSNTGGYLFVGIDSSSGGALGGGAYAGVIARDGAYSLILRTNNTTALTLDSSQRAQFAGNIGLGSAPVANLGIRNSLSLTASGGSAYAYQAGGTLTTAANNDTIFGMAIDNGYSNTGSYTNVSAGHLSLNARSFSGLAFGYGLRIGNITGATSNYAIRTGSGIVSFEDTTASTTTGTGALQVSGGAGIAGAVNVGTYYGMVDGVTAPAATSGYAKIYVDTADGDLKVIFGDGTIKTIATDT